MTTFDLTTIGEGQIRLTCDKGDRLGSATRMRMSAAGSEANVAGLLCQLGRRCSWATVLPREHALTKRIVSEYRAVGVDLSNVVYSPAGRVALYFMEPGEYPMPARILYDREHTHFRDMDIAMFNWDSLLDTRIAFVSGITAALNQNTAKVARYFIDAAVERGIDVVLDVNYRALLWEPQEALAVLNPIARKSKIVFCSRRDTATIYGIEGYGPTACTLLRQRLGVDYVVSTDQVRGVYLSGPQGESHFEVQPVPVIDRPGAGDAFVAGTLHGYLQGDIAAGIGYGQRTAAYAVTHHGDLTYFSEPELRFPVSTDIVR